ncbi:hypothetical protein GCM10020358_53690 [Amorphoplanes nipponensis]|uniref:DUF4386 family protein n=1 Tax=Actinoplanes nipponensis TaxID=135950 RepID=A0A919MRT0_9ACTN|nr:DUF4386 family protein [Actinoplanes nipponensis]GIE47270.1 hypothetical protein Ani05nite_08040 [Actinoplanes nipponensis]
MSTALGTPAPTLRGPAAERTARTRTWYAAVGALLLVESLLIFVPVVVLGRAVNWPAGLDAPAATTLPLVADNLAAVRLGYLFYLAYSLLFLPVIALTVTALTDPAGRSRTVTRMAVALAAVSALARAIGISRWLTTMPGLAEQWQGGDDALRRVLAVQFTVVNDFGGGIGELLGVSAFGAGAVLCATWAVRAYAPRWLTVFGGVAGLAVALPAAELAGADIGPLVVVGTTVVQFWFMATAAVIILRARRGNTQKLS